MSVASAFGAAVDSADSSQLTGSVQSRRRRTCRAAFAALALGTFTALRAFAADGVASVAAGPFGEFKPAGANWQQASDISGDPRHDKALEGTPGNGVWIDNPSESVHDSLQTTWEHGDVDVDLDFLLPAGSNSGVYLQGRYEVQLFDSWGVKTPTYADCGGIYHQWDPSRGAGHEGSGGSAPLANACRAPGLWQHLRIEFRAPRFDAAGKKTANAQFLKVLLNGYLVQENVEVPGVTRGAIARDEKASGPLVIQGDHGSVALRNFSAKRYGAEHVTAQNLTLEFYSGIFSSPAEYEKDTPKRKTAITQFTGAVTDADGKGAAVFTGDLIVPVDGEYTFEVRSMGMPRLLLDGRPVVAPNPGGRNLGKVVLRAGSHALRIDQPQGALRNLTRFSVWCEGPGIARQLIGATAEPKVEQAPPIFLEPKDRILLQRTFTRFEGAKRIYTIAVGSPVGTHYTYDLESAAILRVWSGAFLDSAGLWVGRAEDQIAEPSGPSLTLSGKPLLALFADGESLWPARPAAPSKSLGYRIEPNGQPTFLFEYVGVSVADRVTPMVEGRGLTRLLKFTGKPWERSLAVLIAESSTIVRQSSGNGFVVGDREFYIDWPSNAPLQPIIRTNGGAMQLVVYLPGDGAAYDLTYNLVW